MSLCYYSMYIGKSNLCVMFYMIVFSIYFRKGTILYQNVSPILPSWFLSDIERSVREEGEDFVV